MGDEKGPRWMKELGSREPRILGDMGALDSVRRGSSLVKRGGDNKTVFGKVCGTRFCRALERDGEDVFSRRVNLSADRL